MSHILLTGTTGLIGSHFLRSIDETDHVWAIAQREAPADIPANITWVRYDLTTQPLPSGLPSEIDTVIHLAQSPHFREFPAQAAHVFEVNVGSTARLLDFAWRAGAKRFIYASTGGVYGTGELPFLETQPLPSGEPQGFYAATKRCGELLVENFALHFSIITLRFFFVYGPGQAAGMLIPRLIQLIRQDQPLTLQGSDGIRINPLYVGDAVLAIRAAMRLEGRHTINLGGPEALSMREIGEIIGRCVGKDPQFVEQLDKQPGHLVGDIHQMTRLLVAPSVQLAEGVRRLLASPAAVAARSS